MATQEEIVVPDIGDFEEVEVIEVSVKAGDTIEVDSTLITLETDKAAMDIPSPKAGHVQSLKVKVGDKVSKGSVILILEPAEVSSTAKPAPIKEEKAAPTEKKPEAKPAPIAQTPPVEKATTVMPAAPVVSTEGIEIYAGPAIRRYARELGVNLAYLVGRGTGRKGRLLRTDIEKFVKESMQRLESGAAGGSALPKMPRVDFNTFGPVTVQPLSRIKKLSGANLHRNWVVIPHVTQFDEADITELEAFRQTEKIKLEKEGIRLTPLVFIMKATVAALKEFPHFNASLDPDGDKLYVKQYYHLGVAVDTPNGLVVPVIRNCDQKGMKELSKELSEISEKARLGQLKAQDMQGSCFSISSLGGIGGTAFTPIINAPDVAILGVSKSFMKPVYEAGKFVPRLTLPLSLSYDHRVIDGAEAARFTRFLAAQLADVRRLLL